MADPDELLCGVVPHSRLAVAANIWSDSPYDEESRLVELLYRAYGSVAELWRRYGRYE